MTANPADMIGSRQWELGAAQRQRLVIASGVTVLLAVLGPVLVLTTAPHLSTGYLGFSIVFWVLICVQVVSLFLRGVTRVVITPDGRLEAHRPIGTLRTHASRVTRIGHSAWGGPNQYRRTTKIWTADGNVLLAYGFGHVFEVATTVRQYNPDVRIDL